MTHVSKAYFAGAKMAYSTADKCARDAEYAESLGDKFRAQCLAEWRKAMAVYRLYFTPTHRRLR